MTGQTSRVKACCLKLALLLRSRGRFPWWGDLLIPRYQGPPGRLSRGAGRPMGPSTPRCFFLKAVLFFARFLNQPLELNQDESKDIALRISRIRFVGPLSLSPCLASVWSSLSGFALGGRGASPQRLFIDDVACLDRRLDDAPCSSLLTPHSPLIMFCLGQRFGRLETVCFGGNFSFSSSSSSSSSSSFFSSSSSSPPCRLLLVHKR